MRDEPKRALIEKSFKELPIFKSLSDPHLLQLSSDFIKQHIKKGENVFYQSDHSTDLYIVLDGSVRASLLGEDGEEMILTDFNKGDFFGEMSLLDGKPRSATIRAKEDSTLGVLKRERFLRAIKNDPAIAIDLLSAVVQRLRLADNMIESLAFLDVNERLLKLLLQIAETEGEKDENGFLKIKKLTHKELASHTGASREAITKVLKVLAFRKIIKEEEGHLLISPDAKNITGLAM